VPFEAIDSVDQGACDWELDRCRFFSLGSTGLMDLANEIWEARFMVFVVEPGFAPSFEQSFHWEIKKATMRASLDANTTDYLSVIYAGLVFQEEVAFEQGEI
jgi:hypothetical protein